MNTRSSNYTGRAARTLNDAFGPYASQGGIWENPEPMDKADKIVIVAGVIAMVALSGLVIAGVL